MAMKLGGGPSSDGFMLYLHPVKKLLIETARSRA
jgi:hypothetical protein